MEQNQEFVSSTTSVPPPPRVTSTYPEVHKSGLASASSPKMIWAWVLLGILMSAVIIVFFSHMLIGGYRQASGLVATLHAQMAQHDWDDIYSTAAPQYRDALTSDDNREIFSGIDRKLGVPMSTKEQNIFVNSNSNGTTIRAIFETRFSQDATATETITWRNWDGHYRLESYNINSVALLSR